MSSCVVCNQPLVRRPGEKPHRFKRRKTCSRECHRETLRRQRPDTRYGGESAGDSSKRMRAQRLYPLEGVVCEEPGCERPAFDRHHINEDPGDNRRENLELLCRRHHRARHVKTPARCSTCGCDIPVGKRHKGRCRTCASYFNRTGRERPWKVDGRREGAAKGVAKPALVVDPIPCANCGIETKPSWKGRCRKCYDFWRLHGFNEERSV